MYSLIFFFQQTVEIHPETTLIPSNDVVITGNTQSNSDEWTDTPAVYFWLFIFGGSVVSFGKIFLSQENK